MVNPFSGQCLLTSRVRYGRPQRCRRRVIIQEEKDGGHGSKGDSSLARATHVGNPHSRGRNQYRGSRVIELSDSFNKKKENKRRERRTKMMIFSFIRFVAACLLCSSQRKKKEGNEPNLHQINTSNGRKCRIERDKDLLLFLFSI